MHTDRWKTLQARALWLFTIAGVLLTIHAGVQAVRVFTEWQTPADVFAPAGHVVALAGLLAIARVVTAGSAARWRLVAVPVGLAMLGWAGLSLVQLSELLGVAPEQVPAWFGPYLLGSLLVGTLSYGLVAIVSLRVEGLDARLGGLLAIPAGFFALLLLSVVVETPAMGGFVIGSGFALAFLTIAYALFADGRLPTRVTAGNVPTR